VKFFDRNKRAKIKHEIIQHLERHKFIYAQLALSAVAYTIALAIGAKQRHNYLVGRAALDEQIHLEWLVEIEKAAAEAMK